VFVGSTAQKWNADKAAAIPCGWYMPGTPHHLGVRPPMMKMVWREGGIPG